MSDMAEAPAQEAAPPPVDVMTRAGMNTFLLQALQEHAISTVSITTNLENKFADYVSQLLAGGGGTQGEQAVDEEAAARTGEEMAPTPGEEIEAELGGNAGNTGGS